MKIRVFLGKRKAPLGGGGVPMRKGCEKQKGGDIEAENSQYEDYFLWRIIDQSTGKARSLIIVVGGTTYT